MRGTVSEEVVYRLIPGWIDAENAGHTGFLDQKRRVARRFQQLTRHQLFVLFRYPRTGRYKPPSVSGMSHGTPVSAAGKPVRLAAGAVRGCAIAGRSRCSAGIRTVIGRYRWPGILHNIDRTPCLVEISTKSSAYFSLL